VDVTVSLATLPTRLAALRKTLASLRGQGVSRVNVFCDGHERAPRDLATIVDCPVVTALARDQRHRLGDTGKFFWADEVQGVHVTIDDDIVYPADYIATLVAALERHGRAIVGVLGLRLASEIDSYYRDRTHRFAVRDGLRVDQPVHVLGTGTTAYVADDIPIRLADFATQNMADVWLAVRARTVDVPMIAVARPQRWLTPIPVTGPTIYGQFRATNDDRLATAVVRRSAPWPPLPPVDPTVCIPADWNPDAPKLCRRRMAG